MTTKPYWIRITLWPLLLLLSACSETRPTVDDAQALFAAERPQATILSVRVIEDEVIERTFEVSFIPKADGALTKAQVIYIHADDVWKGRIY